MKTVNPPPVTNKMDFVRRYSCGEFGNHAPTWDTLHEFLASDYRGLIHIRNRVAGGPTWYNLSPEKVHIQWDKILDSGVNSQTLYLSGMCPTEKTILQGELQQSLDHIDLTYSTVVAPMREALAAETKFAKGIAALSLVQWAMDAPSFDWMQELLDLYPNHVIEFTCLSVCWGTIPNRNTLVWEIRNY